MHPKLKRLKERLLEIEDLEAASALMYWDQSTYMPSGGAEARGRQMATLGRLAHEKFIDPAVGFLLDELTEEEQNLPPESDEACLIRVTRRDYEKATKVPASFMGALSEHGAAAYEAWGKARPANDFKAIQPYMEKTLEMSRQLANYFPGYQHIADPLIDFADEGMKTESVRELFSRLRAELVPLVQRITAQVLPDDSFLKQKYPEADQLDFGREVIRSFGFDFERGRQDKTRHPFMTKFSLGDVRITTRVREDDLSEALFSTLHEAGHALYEQGISMELEGTPLASGTSMGVHESQSRLWENLVGRSRGFWIYQYPRLQKRFPNQLGGVSLESFYRAINRVEKSLIRTDADEVTYNLHVMIRFDFELQLLEGSLAVKDLPEAWRGRYQKDLGVSSPQDAEGVMQDVHWFHGTIGGSFQGYTIGNILSAQIFQAAVRAHPTIPDEIEQGRYLQLHSWLKETIYRHGSKFNTPELIQRALGEPLRIEPYTTYLKEKYGEIYP